MGTLTEVLQLLLWVLVFIPEFESASVFRRMIHDDSEKHEQIPGIHRVQDIYLNKFEKQRPFAVFPFWNKAHGIASTTITPETTTYPPSTSTNSPFVAASFKVDIEFPSSSPKRILPRRVPSTPSLKPHREEEEDEDEKNEPSFRKTTFSNLIKRARQRRKRKQVLRSPIARVRRTTTPHPKEGITPTILTQLRTVSEMLVTRNVTSTRTVTDSPLHYTHTIAFMGDDFTKVSSSPLPHQETTFSTFLPPTTTVATTLPTTTTTITTTSHHRSPSSSSSSTLLPSTTPHYTLFELQQQQRLATTENIPALATTTIAPGRQEFFTEMTTVFPELDSTTFYPLIEEQKQNQEELRSPKKIRDSPVEIELLNPFEDEIEKEIERIPRQEDKKVEKSSEVARGESEKSLYEGSEEDHYGQYYEMNPGQYHEINPGQYHEVNPGQYHEKNPGQYHEINPGQYVHHSENDEGNPTTIQIHHRDEDKKVYNVQSKVDEFIIGEYGTISKSSGQTLQGVRYTAIGESVDSKLIYDTLIKFFNFQ